MKHISIQKWNQSANGPLSLDTLKTLYQPSERYRISANSYPAGTEIKGGSSREGYCYVLSGQITFVWPDHSESVAIRAGEYAFLPEGKHDVQVSKEAPVELIRVWDLSELLASSSIKP